jgi:hypothetical protein
MKRRSEGRASHHQSLLLKMKMIKPQTRMGKVLAIASTVAATLKRILNMKKIPRRLTSPADIAETFALCDDF